MRMVEAIFNQPDYVAAKKVLAAGAVRQQGIANNIANLETPGYRRVDLAPTFQSELERACASGDAQQSASLEPSLAPDPAAAPLGRDGNSVNLDKEMSDLNQNAVLHSVETEMVSNTLWRLRLAITGKSA